jgi:S1-C subfamily serine protease
MRPPIKGERIAQALQEGKMAIASLQDWSDQLAAAVEQVARSLARVDARNRVAGTGIVWSSEGIVVTADHVVEREEDIHVQLDGTTYDAELVGRDPTTDLAVLRVNTKNAIAAQVADSTTLKQGNLVFAVGRPWGGEAIVSAGVVSAVGRLGFWQGWGEQFREGLIHADVTLYPGFSGGPLADASGRVVGVNTSAIGRGMSLAVPTETASRVVTELLKEGRIRRGYLGIGVQKIPLSDALKTKLSLSQDTGLVVLTVESKSAADTAGFLPGDILIGANGATLARVRELHRWLSSERAGQQVKARVIRGGEIKEFAVTVGER